VIHALSRAFTFPCKKTFTSARGSVLEFSSLIFRLANCASAAYEFAFRSALPSPGNGFHKARTLGGKSRSRLRGIRQAWRSGKLLNDLERGSSLVSLHAPEIAVIYAALGDRAQAMNWLEKGYEEHLIRVSSCDRASIPSAPICSSKTLHAVLVSIIKLDNLRSKAKMRLIPGEEFFGVQQFGALGGRLAVFEELSGVANSGPSLLE
jgi:hypothetical protein